VLPAAGRISLDILIVEDEAITIGLMQARPGEKKNIPVMYDKNQRRNK